MKIAPMLGYLLVVFHVMAGFAFGGTVQLSPMDNINDAIRIHPGGTVFVLDDGVYDQSIGATFQSAPYNNFSLPDGSADAWTAIVAKNPGKAIIQGGLYLGGPRRNGRTEGSSYIMIDSLKFRGGAIAIINSHHVVVLNTGIKNPMRRQRINGEYLHYGNGITISGSNHILIERSWVVGAFRYGILVTKSKQVIARMLVLRADTYSGGQPHAEFCVYGEDGSQGIESSRDVKVQNVFVLDSNRNPKLQYGVGGSHGYHDIHFMGCGVFNVPKNGFGGHEHIPGGNNIWEDCVAGLIGKTGIYWRTGSPDKTITLEGVDVISADAIFGQWSGRDDGKYAKVIGEVTENRRVPAIRYGKSLTLWGDEGFDQPVGSIWPWPNHDRIIEDFVEVDTVEYLTENWEGKPLPVNNPDRGFAHHGNLKTYIENIMGVVAPVIDEPDPDTTPTDDEAPEPDQDLPAVFRYPTSALFVNERLYKLPIPGGWLILNSFDGEAVIKIDDPEHTWIHQGEAYPYTWREGLE